MILILDSCPQSKRKLTHAKCFCLDVYKFGGTEVNPVISSDCFCSWAKCGNYSGNCVKAVDVAKPRADKLPAYQYKTKTKLKKRKDNFKLKLVNTVASHRARLCACHASPLVGNTWQRAMTRNNEIHSNPLKHQTILTI